MLRSEIDRIRTSCDAAYRENPSVWLATGAADSMLLALIADALAERSSPRPSRRAGSAEQDANAALLIQAERIAAIYRNAFQRGASPRERASIREHFDFVIAMLEDIANRATTEKAGGRTRTNARQRTELPALIGILSDIRDTLRGAP